MVNPSGERADRPQFLAMLELVKVGDVDIVLCWRDDRLVRHPKVAVALEDALDIGDAQRNGKGKIEIRDATGAMIDRFTLSIKATIWREENKRRAERTRMGKIATLQQGRWPTCYNRFGYTTRKDGGRGRIIEIEETEAAAVRKIHEMFDASANIGEIRRYLIAENVPQKLGNGKHMWSQGVIYGILHAEDYTGIATFDFSDGISISVEIPAIIDRELWERNQVRIERNKELSTRNAGGVYLLQNIKCGECGVLMHVRRKLFSYVGGKKRPFPIPPHYYFCSTAGRYPEEQCPPNSTRYGPTLDWLVWRRVVDYGIKQPEIIREQVQARQVELQVQGDSIDGDIAHARRRLEQIAQERESYQMQLAKGWMTEDEFVKHIDRTKDDIAYWESELARLQELGDNRDKVQAGLDYTTKLLTTIQKELPRIDIPYNELKKLPEKERNEILAMRREIIRALVDKVVVYAGGEVKVCGLLDGSEATQFGLGGWSSGGDRV